MGVVEIEDGSADGRNSVKKREAEEAAQALPAKSMSSQASAIASAAATVGNRLLPVDMFRKTAIMAMRNRRSITIALYGLVLCLLAVLVYDPTLLDVVFPFVGLTTAADVDDGRTGDAAAERQRAVLSGGVKPSTTRPTPIMSLLDLPFVPRDFRCDEMHAMVRHADKSKRYIFHQPLPSAPTPHSTPAKLSYR